MKRARFFVAFVAAASLLGVAGIAVASEAFDGAKPATARFHDVDLTNARFHLVDLTGAMIRGAALVNVDISGEVDNLRVNGVDVVPLVEAELDRRYPDRVKKLVVVDIAPKAYPPSQRPILTALQRLELQDQRRLAAGRRGAWVGTAVPELLHVVPA
jgi:hypothetical protein